jgi:carbonic anhydrase
MAFSRRHLLQAAGLVAGGLALPKLSGGPAQAAGATASKLAKELTVCSPPTDPLAELLSRNGEFSKAWQQAVNAPTASQRMELTKSIFAAGCQINPAALAKGQKPWAALLSCADARVAPEWIFAAGSGELFQVRAAGNTAFDDAIASMEYAVAVLGVPLILVMGHSACGAVKAAMASDPLTPLLEGLVKPIRASLQPGDDLTKAIQGNARYSTAALTQRSDVLKQAQASGKVSIKTAYFDIGTGKVSVI